MFLLSNASLRFSYPTLEAETPIGGVAVHSSSLTGSVPQGSLIAVNGPIVSTGLHSKYRPWTRIRLNQVSVFLSVLVFQNRPPPPRILGYKTYAPPLGRPSHERALSYDTIVNRSKSLT